MDCEKNKISIVMMQFSPILGWIKNIIHIQKNTKKCYSDVYFELNLSEIFYFSNVVVSIG